MKFAFTLVEILTCLAIIGVLLAILLPVLMQSKQNAYKSTCQSNLRSVGQAVRIYIDDNDGTWPDVQVWNCWNQVGVTKVASCPATRISPDKILELQIRGQVAGYAYNANIVSWNESVGGTEGNTYPVFHPAADRDFVYPAVTVTFMDAGINSWLANEPDPNAHIRPYPYNAERG